MDAQSKASPQQLSRRKILTARSPSRHQHRTSDLNNHERDISSVSASQSSYDSTSSPSSIAAQATFTPLNPQRHRSSLGSDLQQQYTIRNLHNVTPRSSPRPATLSLSQQTTNVQSDHLQLPHSDNSPAFAFTFTSPKEKSKDIPTLQVNSTSADVHQDGTETQTWSFGPRSDKCRHLGSSSLATETLDQAMSFGIQSLQLCDESNTCSEQHMTIPYDVRDEHAPEAPFFSPKFQAALRNGMNIAKDATDVLARVSAAVPEQDVLKILEEQARGLSSFQGSDTRTIAVLGDSGEGKSTLINSLLNFSEIARTGNLGSACTSVVTEYRQKKSDQQAPILLEVEYYSTVQIEAVIKDLLCDFRKFYLPHVESQTTSASDYTCWQRNSEQAWSALESAFKHHPRFSQEFLRDTSKGALERITKQLLEWAGELEWPSGASDGRWSSTASSADDCCTKTSMFMQDRYWPFTKIIRVFVNAQILKTGVILADLPGLHDTNFARVRNTHDYLLGCDAFLIVANISRAITNQSLKSSLYNVLSQHVPMEWDEPEGPNLQFAVVCTMSENFEVEKERRKLIGGKGSDKEVWMSQLDDEIQQAKQKGDRDRKKNLKQKQKLILLEARNALVRTGLQQAYSKAIPTGTLPVFCVSNSWYQKYAKKGDKKMVQASGVPELRRYCHSLTAQAQLLEAQNMLQVRLQSLLNSMDIWTKKGPTEQNAPKLPSFKTIEEQLQKVKCNMTEDIVATKEKYLGSFDEVFFPYFTERSEFWERDACQRHGDWTTWHPSQYNAWCMNDGRHSTPKRPFLDWNSEIIWKMRSEIAYDWGILEEDIPPLFSDLLEDIENRLRSVKEFWEEKDLPSLLNRAVDLRIHDLQYQVGVMQKSFSDQMQYLRREAFEPSGFVLREMSTAYRDASAEHGPGKNSRQIQHVGGRLRSGSLFPNIAFRTRTKFESLLEDIVDRLHDLVRSAFLLLERDIELAMSKDLVAENLKSKEATENMSITLQDLKSRYAQVLRDLQVQ